MSQETYIPSARNAVIAYFGRNASGNLRQLCVRCNDTSPLTGDQGEASAHKIYGDLYVATGDRDHAYPEDTCDACGVSFLKLSQMCQAEHDGQQARWARTRTADGMYLIEYGVRALVRCRVY